MIIRNRTTKTLKASTLSNRGSCRPPEGMDVGGSTLKGCPCIVMGDPLRVDVAMQLSIWGCSLRSYPQLLSVDRTSGLAGGMIADYHKNDLSVLANSIKEKRLIMKAEQDVSGLLDGWLL